MKKEIFLMIFLSLIFGLGGFFIGVKYQEGKKPQGRFFSRTGQPFQRRGGLRPFSGEIISLGEKTFSLKLSDGSSKMILFNEKTNISRQEKGEISDLKEGEKIMVFGSENTDGTIEAQSIQLNPSFFFPEGRITP